MTTAGVFDLDNTLVRGSLLFHFGIDMARRRLIKGRDVLRYARSEAIYVSARHEIDGIGPRVAAHALRMVASLDAPTVQMLAREFVFARLERLLVPEVREQVVRMQKVGASTVLATASPQELADAVATWLGMDLAIGTRSEVVDGKYTGLLEGPINHGPAKAARVAAALSDLGVAPSAAWAFSDSIHDEPLLSLVGFPVATNPDRRLRTLAQDRGWRLLDGRSGDAGDRYPMVRLLG